MKSQGILFKSFLLVLSLSLFAGCSNKSASTTESQPTVDEQDVFPKGIKNLFKSTPENSKIFILFGYGFNDSSFKNHAVQKLSAKYGLAENGGLIYPLTYPDDFMQGGKEHINSLYDILTAQKIKGIILLGAPGNTNMVLARLQDDYEGMQPYPVFSFFPQDDILGMEATCDFVVEYERLADDEVNSEETDQQIDKSVETILVNAVRYMSDLSGPLPANENLHDEVQQIVGKDKKVWRFTDSETGLQPINHFIIKREAKK